MPQSLHLGVSAACSNARLGFRNRFREGERGARRRRPSGLCRGLAMPRLSPRPGTALAVPVATLRSPPAAPSPVHPAPATALALSFLVPALKTPLRWVSAPAAAPQSYLRCALKDPNSTTPWAANPSLRLLPGTEPAELPGCRDGTESRRGPSPVQ